MKNMYLMATLALLIFAGCSDDEYSGKDLPGTKAEIRGTINELATRASETSWTDGDCIGITVVSGSDINIKYQASGADGAFSPVNGEGEDNTIYLKGSTGVTLNAYYPYTGENGTAPGAIAVNTARDKQTAAEQPKIDFLFATGEGSRTSSTVNFSFDHKMSKLVFVFIAGDGTTLAGLKYTLSSLKLNGTFNTDTGEAQTGGTAEDLAMNVALPGSGSMVSSLILLPQDIDELNMELEMSGKFYSSKIEDLYMIKGYEYTYNVTINSADGENIPTLTITAASINPWTKEDEKNITADPVSPGTDVSPSDPSQWGDSEIGGPISSENV